jgi:hypothetical protein
LNSPVSRSQFAAGTSVGVTELRGLFTLLDSSKRQDILRKCKDGATIFASLPERRRLVRNASLKRSTVQIVTSLAIGKIAI